MIEFRHPEQRQGEIFLTNSKPAEARLIGWRSVRLGEDAYALVTNDGTFALLADSDLRPVFVSVAEVKEAGLLERIATSAYNGHVRVLFEEGR